MSRSLLARAVALTTVMIAATVVFFSQSVADAWGDLASPDHFDEGSMPYRLLAWRAGLQEADVHLVLWLGAGLALVTWVSSRRVAAASAAALVILAVGIELLQPMYSTRNGQVADAIGGVLGVAIAVALRGARSLRRSVVVGVRGPQAGRVVDAEAEGQLSGRMDREHVST